MNCIRQPCKSEHNSRSSNSSSSGCRGAKPDDSSLSSLSSSLSSPSSPSSSSQRAMSNERCGKKTRKKMAATSVPPVLKPRYDNALFCIAIWAIVKHMIGVLFTAVVFLILLLVAPLVFIFRFLQMTRYRTTHTVAGQSAPSIRHCDVWWPLYGAPTRAVLTLETAPNAELFTMQMNNILKLEEIQDRCNCFGRESNGMSIASFNVTPSAVVDVWDQKKVRTVKDLMSALNDGTSFLNSIIKSHFSIHTMIVPNFSACSDRTVSLAIITHSVDYFPYCVLRLLSLYTDGRLVFDIEPKMGESFTPGQTAYTLCNRLAKIVQFICIGPLTVLTLALQKRNFIWDEIRMEATPTTATIHRTNDSDGDTDEAVLMENIGGEKKKSPSNKHVYRWLRIPQIDQLNRAERILRAASIELFVAFVAGTLRRHFRFLGIMHPTDISAVVPISYREFMPVEAQKPCDIMLLPIQIPCDVEGIIPRIWAVQRRLAGVVEGVVPTALHVSRFLCDLSVSCETSRSLFTTLYANSCTVISLLRTSGDVELDSQHIQSILLYPSIPATIKAAFTFVQTGSQVMLSLSVCQQYFPDPDRLLLHFKAEVLCLLDQLATRLLTLSQTTFLPVQLPFLCEVIDETNKVDEMKPAKELSPLAVRAKESPEKMDVDELQQFISNIQKELDTLRTSRDANQDEKEEHIKKLTELESQMKVFHDQMARRFGTPNLETLKEDAELASNAVAELLAPYREESGNTRRFSREFLRTDMIRRPSDSNLPW